MTRTTSTSAVRVPEMTAETKEVLARLVEYALIEARREGETECACHLYQALDALTRIPEVIDWPLDVAVGSRLAS